MINHIVLCNFIMLTNSVDDKCRLSPDPEQEKYYPNNIPRPVKDGHYVMVKTTPLPDPVLVHHSMDMAELLNINDNINSQYMINYLSGNIEELDGWATPYALSIYGTERVDNCPYGNDTGYGDGRAISIGLFEISGNIYELQLKGAGRTPFSRKGDGRATFRSSLREYLASEAMYNMGIPTTRTLSLITSKSELIKRPSYKISDGTMHSNHATVICRVARSFYRIGHFELFSRRTRNTSANKDKLVALYNFTIHVIKRDYPEIYDRNLSIDEQILIFLNGVSLNLAFLTAKWMGVGYVQSNMNSDNCSVAGLTLDYGPFGFMDVYDRNKNFWESSGDHFSYKNQPNAVSVNFKMLCNSVKPLLTLKYSTLVDCVAAQFSELCKARIGEEFKQKLGFKNIKWDDGVCSIFKRCEELLQKTSMDWTIFWRELSHYPTQTVNNIHSIMSACYDKNKYVSHIVEWNIWISDWLALLGRDGRSGEIISNHMLKINPKHIPREWMLAKAYEDAKKRDYRTINELYILFLDPYDATNRSSDKWYKLTPPELINKPGISSMTCSS